MLLSFYMFSAFLFMFSCSFVCSKCFFIFIYSILIICTYFFLHVFCMYVPLLSSCAFLLHHQLAVTLLFFCCFFYISETYTALTGLDDVLQFHFLLSDWLSSGCFLVVRNSYWLVLCNGVERVKCFHYLPKLHCVTFLTVVVTVLVLVSSSFFCLKNT